MDHNTIIVILHLNKQDWSTIQKIGCERIGKARFRFFREGLDLIKDGENRTLE